ncbi:hypothetical protein B6N60_00458 [Richelia sinica FACHB-800]|uniref:Uncharacterized protein n=1 Tax=Richelia sinica FACHB-800 TaxID=1357546 RepID=A0A975Y359_9NOST|nr:hypothetical protein [Richelia sinica]MBD2662937.1 hypothetical protein [Richelia sinica FACHB-800]QXE21780.1 hypothetical protein B6N60_00458 [Richelia sinica FACHB-800]
MTDKNLDALITKIVKKVMKKEIEKFKAENLAIVSTQINEPLETLKDTNNNWENAVDEEVIENIYTSRYINISAKEAADFDYKLRELKFRQELLKDWILFILKDVVVYSLTILFIFSAAGFYLFSLVIHK